MKHIWRWILMLKFVIFLHGSGIAQGLTLRDYPRLLNDSTIGITFPQMDYVNFMKLKIEEITDERELFRNSLMDSWRKIEERDSLLLNYVELNKYYIFEVNNLKTNNSVQQNVIKELNLVIYKEQRKNKLYIVVGSFTIGGLFTYIVLDKVGVL